MREFLDYGDWESIKADHIKLPTDREGLSGRLERGDQPGARRTGVGFGLSLVQSFNKLHGGDVELESALGVGTKVVCRLPARRARKELPRALSQD